jgi:LysR family transcriptional regulator, nod-box dependent transcriptional activator
MRFKQLDLNLIVTLDALLTHRSVSEAARQLFRTQPSVSAALAQLREHFNDELMMPIGRKMVLTAFAEGIVAPVHALMQQIELTMGPNPVFDPATARRTFTIGASDYVADVVLTKVVAQLAHTAPGIVLDLVLMGDEGIRALEAGELDFIMVPQSFCAKDHPTEILYEEQHVVIGWAENPALAVPLTSEALLQLGQVVVRTGRSHNLSVAEIEMNRFAHAWRIETIVSNFSAAPRMLIGTNRVAVLQRRLAERAARELPLVIQPMPFPFPALREAIQYHRVRGQDPAIQWVKQCVLDCAAMIT